MFIGKTGRNCKPDSYETRKENEMREQETPRNLSITRLCVMRPGLFGPAARSCNFFMISGTNGGVKLCVQRALTDKRDVRVIYTAYTCCNLD